MSAGLGGSADFTSGNYAFLPALARCSDDVSAEKNGDARRIDA
jgi:hypothetical protein